MKKHLLLLAVTTISCSTGQTSYRLPKNAPIVDYNKSYEFYDNSLALNAAAASYTQQTVVIYNGKEIPYKKFQQLVKKEKIKSIENILDKEKIQFRILFRAGETNITYPKLKDNRRKDLNQHKSRKITGYVTVHYEYYDLQNIIF